MKRETTTVSTCDRCHQEYTTPTPQADGLCPRCAEREKREKQTTTEKPTKAGVKAALQSLGYTSQNDTPPALRAVEAAPDFTPAEMAFARYLVYDTDFGGAWNDNAQIDMHCA